MVTKAAASPPAWAWPALEAACGWARRAGLDGVFAIAPYELPPAAGLAGGAERANVGDEMDVAGALVEALGVDNLRRLAVAYVDCFADARDHRLLAREVAQVAAVSGGALVVEPEQSGALTEVGAALRAAAPEMREHRLVPPEGGLPPAAVIRLFVCSPVPATSTGLPPLRIAISDHQGKSLAIADALVTAGHVVVDRAETADIVLIDHDAPFHGKLPLVDACVANGGRAFLYPHGADPAMMSSWDGLYPACPHLSGALVLADGHAEIARRWGYPFPTHVIGWPFCEQRPRRTRPVKRVLFAPTHPPYLGNPRYPGRNAEIFGRLLQCPVDVEVRHVGSLEENGLWEAPGVAYVRGDAPGSPGMLDQIDAADAVLADRSTFGNLSLARGVTTVLWDSAIVLNNDGTRSPDHLDLYREYLRYPFDADGAGLWQVLSAAAEDVEHAAGWSRRFIGTPLDVNALIVVLRGL